MNGPFVNCFECDSMRCTHFATSHNGGSHRIDVHGLSISNLSFYSSFYVVDQGAIPVWSAIRQIIVEISKLYFFLKNRFFHSGLSTSCQMYTCHDFDLRTVLYVQCVNRIWFVWLSDFVLYQIKLRKDFKLIFFKKDAHRNWWLKRSCGGTCTWCDYRKQECFVNSYITGLQGRYR